MIYLHRANSIASLNKASELKIGIETDVRWSSNQGLCISHDPVISKCQTLKLFLEEINEREIDHLILDVKDQGLVPVISELLVSFDSKHNTKYLSTTYLTDLIVPDHMQCYKHGLLSLARNSKIEQIQFGDGYWCDYIIDPNEFLQIPGFVINSHKVLVARELHTKEEITEDYKAYVEKAKELFQDVCTDYPEAWL